MSPDLPLPLDESLVDVSIRVDELVTLLVDCPTFKDHEPFIRNDLLPVFATSSYLLDQCKRSPELLPGLLDEGLEKPRSDGREPDGDLRELEQQLAEWVKFDDDEDAVIQGLRRFRHREMCRIILRERLDLASVSQTLEDLTALADVCVAWAEAYSHQVLQRRFGAPRDEEGEEQRLITLGMGKLGGRELNFSSDIDLILVFPTSGQTDGPRKLDNSEFFRKLAQLLVRILGKTTSDGFVYRVDLRLRPFGDSGPLVMNFDGIENYYLTQGREWERYAMIKARPMTGTPQGREALMALLHPFVYRRYLDYGAFESLRDLKRRIVAQVQKKGQLLNIKLGNGGIREIEFIGQAFQLVRGGREPALQQRSIIAVLEACARLEILDPADVEKLIEAYAFLRLAENALQMIRDQQTHSLPDNDADWARLLLAMNYTDKATFEQTLAHHTQTVSLLFQSLFRTEDEDDQPPDDPWELLWIGHANEPISAEWLEAQGMEEPEELANNLNAFSDSAFYHNLTARAQQLVDKLIPQMLREVAERGGSRRAWQGLLKLLRSVAGRSVYLQILVETPPVVGLLVRLFSRSSWIADFVCQHPIVIDELLDYRNIENPPDHQDLKNEMELVLERIRDQELDVQMDSLRHYRQATTMRVAAAELEGKLELMKVSDRLSWIAEITLQAVSDLIWDQLIKRHGKPTCVVDGDTHYPGFAVVAYGKLGGLELGYRSDLDIVFLHESRGQSQVTEGDKPIENPVFFGRLAQKVVHFISTLTPAGVLYEIDTRLRPNGQSGLLVSNITAFEQYQLNEAWTWEHQALVRARIVVGNQRLRQAFGAVRNAVLGLQRDSAKLRVDVEEMREKMRSNLGSKDSSVFDLKQDHGGIADIEFMVQYLVLWQSTNHGALTEVTDNMRLLDAFEAHGLLDQQSASQLREAYLAFRQQVHKLALLEQKARVGLDSELISHRDNVRQIWSSLMLE